MGVNFAFGPLVLICGINQVGISKNLNRLFIIVWIFILATNR